MTQVPDDKNLADLLKRLSQQLNGQDMIVLSADEVLHIREVIKAWVVLKTLMTFGGMLKTVALWILAISGAIVAIKSGLVSWLFDAGTPKQ
jgi:hypothetical protein